MSDKLRLVDVLSYNVYCLTCSALGLILIMLSALRKPYQLSGFPLCLAPCALIFYIMLALRLALYALSLHSIYKQDAHHKFRI